MSSLRTLSGLATATAALLPAAAAAAQCANGPTYGPATTLQPFGLGGHALAAADLDGDGDLDLVAFGAPEGLRVLRNDGPGAFLLLPPIPLEHTNGIAAADFDADGRVDVAACGVRRTTTSTTAVMQGRLDVLFNTTAPGSNAITFAPPMTLLFGPPGVGGSIGTAVAAADLDADGVLDFAIADLNSTNAWVMLGQGAGGRPTGTWAAATPFAVGRTGHYDIDVADFDLDGAPDLALTNFGDGVPGVVTLLRNQTGANGEALGTFVGAGTVSIAAGARALCVRDLDADGALDLAVAARFAVVVARGVAGFTFGPPVATPVQEAMDIAAADLDGDGRLDLCVPQAVSSLGSPGNVAVLRDLGAGFAVQPFNLGSGFPAEVALGDFDGDGSVDLAIGKATGRVTVARATCGRGLGAVALLAPIGGETWTVGSRATIDWFATANVGPVDVELSRDDGRSWQLLAAGVTTAPLSWPVTPPSTNAARVRVRPSATTLLANASAGTFVITGPGLAAATPVGAGCGAPAPSLRSGVPILGGRADLELRGGLPGALAGFYGSLPPLAPTPITPTCTAWLDLAGIALVASAVTDAQGDATAVLRVTANPALLGVTFRTQALTLGFGAAAGLELTNAVDLLVGL